MLSTNWRERERISFVYFFRHTTYLPGITFWSLSRSHRGPTILCITKSPHPSASMFSGFCFASVSDLITYVYICQAELPCVHQCHSSALPPQLAIPLFASRRRRLWISRFTSLPLTVRMLVSNARLITIWILALYSDYMQSTSSWDWFWLYSHWVTTTRTRCSQ